MKLSDIITRQMWAQLWQWLVTFLLKGKQLPSWSWHIISYIGQWIYKKFIEYVDSLRNRTYKKNREEAQEKAKAEFDAVKNKPGTTADEFADKFEDMINAGKDSKR